MDMLESIAQTEGEIDSLDNIVRAFDYLQKREMPKTNHSGLENVIKNVNKILGYSGEYAENERKAHGYNIYYDEPWKIKYKMENLILDVQNHTIKEEEFALRFLKIHPFKDGNGRTLKLVMSHIYNKLYLWENQKEFVTLLKNDDVKNMKIYLSNITK